MPLNIFSKDRVLTLTVFTGYPCKHGVGLIVRENKNLEISVMVIVVVKNSIRWEKTGWMRVIPVLPKFMTN